MLPLCSSPPGDVRHRRMFTFDALLKPLQTPAALSRALKLRVRSAMSAAELVDAVKLVRNQRKLDEQVVLALTSSVSRIVEVHGTVPTPQAIELSAILSSALRSPRVCEVITGTTVSRMLQAIGKLQQCPRDVVSMVCDLAVKLAPTMSSSVSGTLVSLSCFSPHGVSSFHNMMFTGCCKVMLGCCTHSRLGSG